MNPMRKILKRAVGVVVGAASAAGTMVAFAQSTQVNTSVTLLDPLGGTNFSKVTTNVIQFLATDIAIPLTVIMVLVGAFQMMTSAGDPEKFSQGRKTLTYAAIGFAVALLATGITSLINNILTGK